MNIFSCDVIVLKDDVDVDLESDGENVALNCRTNELSRKNHENWNLQIADDISVANLNKLNKLIFNFIC